MRGIKRGFLIHKFSGIGFGGSLRQGGLVQIKAAAFGKGKGRVYCRAVRMCRIIEAGTSGDHRQQEGAGVVKAIRCSAKTRAAGRGQAFDIRAKGNAVNPQFQNLFF